MGIRATLTRLETLLEQADPELWHHLQVKNKVWLTGAQLRHLCPQGGMHESCICWMGATCFASWGAEKLNPH